MKLKKETINQETSGLSSLHCYVMMVGRLYGQNNNDTACRHRSTYTTYAIAIRIKTTSKNIARCKKDPVTTRSHLSPHNPFMHTGHEIIDLFRIRNLRQIGVFFCVIQPFLKFIQKFGKFFGRLLVLIEKFSVADFHQKWKILFPVRVDFSFFENIKCHQVKSDKVHHVFGKFGVLNGVFISFSQFVIVSDDAVHLIPHGAVVAERIMLQRKIHVDFGFHIIPR